MKGAFSLDRYRNVPTEGGALKTNKMLLPSCECEATKIDGLLNGRFLLRHEESFGATFIKKTTKISRQK